MFFLILADFLLIPMYNNSVKTDYDLTRIFIYYRLHFWFQPYSKPNGLTVLTTCLTVTARLT